MMKEKTCIKRPRFGASQRTNRSKVFRFEQLENRVLLSADFGQTAGTYDLDYLETVQGNSFEYAPYWGVRHQDDSSELAELQEATVWHSPSVSRQLVAEPPNDRLARLQPTSVVDDVFENNDFRYQASDLGPMDQVRSVTGLVMSDRADWYRFHVNRSTDASAAVSIQFRHALGDLDLAVYDTGGRLVGYSNGTTDRETVSLPNLHPGTYYVLVYGYGGAKNPNYALNVNPGQGIADDRFEPDNSFGHAANLGALATAHTENALVMADAGDWYRFTTNGPGTSSASVGIAFQHSRGDLDLEVYDAHGRRVGLSAGVGNREHVSLDGLPSGAYYAHVYGYRGATNPTYSLIVDPGVRVPVPATRSPSSGFQIEMNLRGLTASQRSVLREAAARWQQVIVGDLPDAVYNGRPVDDILIDVRAGSFDGPGGILGGAAPDRFRTGTSIPYHGAIQFDTADLAQMEANGTLPDVVLHEIGHVLGFGTIWQRRGLLAGTNTGNPRFMGAGATAQYNALCHCGATSVPVANRGGAGTRNGHWRESVFANELMTGFVGPGLNLPLSRITVASLADLGYQVDLAAADPYQLA